MTIKLFGISKEIVGSSRLTIVETEPITTVADLKQWLSQQYPALQGLQSFAIAVDSEYADDAQHLQNSSEIALIPPVSGG